MPSDYRLRRKSDFARVYAKGRSHATDLIVVCVLPRSQDILRLGFSVSGKLGKAAVRNRIRRRMREAARSLLPNLRRGHDVVVTARKKAVEGEYRDFVEALEQLFGRAGLSARH